MAYGQIRTSGGRTLNLSPQGWINNEGENLNAAPGNALYSAMQDQSMPQQNRLAQLAQAPSLSDFLESQGTSMKNRVDYNGKQAFMAPDGSVVWQNPDGSAGKATIRNPAQDAFEKQQLAMDTARANLEQTRAQTAAMNQPKPANLQHVETENGIMAFNPQTGQMTPIQSPSGQTMTGGKALTEAQGKSTGFATRARTASDIVQNIGRDGQVQPGLIKRAAESVPLIGEGLGTLLNSTQSPQQQQVEQGQRDFINAVLRQESGAAIAESEFANAKKQYFPQPGDSQEVIAQKNANRENAIRAFEVQAGPGLRRMQQSKQPPSMNQNQQLINDARAAIQGGANPAAVKQRLQQMGINSEGL